ncbi:MAG TPA: hypothetical protein V6C65_01890 [Allocoleopsis sp.]
MNQRRESRGGRSGSGVSPENQCDATITAHASCPFTPELDWKTLRVAE